MPLFSYFDWPAWRRVWMLRIIVGAVLGASVLGWYYQTDPDKGADTTLRLQFLAWAFVAVFPAYLIRRALVGEARGHEALRKAMAGSVSAALVFIGLCILQAVVFCVLMLGGAAHADEVPANARALLPVLKSEQVAFWPTMPDPPALGAQVEKESCVSLKSAMCWNPRAELFTYEAMKAGTAREYGWGLGQCTETAKFSCFAQSRALDVSLRDWKFADRFDPRRQLRVIVLMDRGIYTKLPATVAVPHERLAMTLAAYNGGAGGLQSDRRLCAAVRGCNPNVWFGQVELHSLKSRVVQRGYGQSFFDVNRAYPREILGLRRARYMEWL